MEGRYIGVCTCRVRLCALPHRTAGQRIRTMRSALHLASTTRDVFSDPSCGQLHPLVSPIGPRCGLAEQGARGTHIARMGAEVDGPTQCSAFVARCLYNTTTRMTRHLASGPAQLCSPRSGLTDTPRYSPRPRIRSAPRSPDSSATLRCTSGFNSSSLQLCHQQAVAPTTNLPDGGAFPGHGVGRESGARSRPPIGGISRPVQHRSTLPRSPVHLAPAPPASSIWEAAPTRARARPSLETAPAPLRGATRAGQATNPPRQLLDHGDLHSDAGDGLVHLRLLQHVRAARAAFSASTCARQGHCDVVTLASDVDVRPMSFPPP